MANLDVVNGVVIGPVTFLATLHCPNGREYARSCRFDSEEDARAWALERVQQARADVGPDEARRLDWNQPWEVRFHG